MPRRRRHRRTQAGLSAAEFEEAIAAHQAGQSFAEIGNRYGLSHSFIYRALDQVGAILEKPKPRAELQPDLLLADWREGLSCRQIAAKHDLPYHRLVADALRARGIDVRSRPARRSKHCPGVVLGKRTSDRLSERRRRCRPLKIPPRTVAEMRIKGWTRAERRAIERELWAGRVTICPRGRSGVPAFSPWSQQARVSFIWLARWRRGPALAA